MRNLFVTMGGLLSPQTGIAMPIEILRGNLWNAFEDRMRALRAPGRALGARPPCLEYRRYVAPVFQPANFRLPRRQECRRYAWPSQARPRVRPGTGAALSAAACLRAER